MHVHDLRDLNLIKQGKLELRIRRIELAPLIERAIDMVDAETRHRPRTLEVTQLAEPVYLSADPMRIEQVIGRLLSNASRFTGPGGNIWLEVERQRNAVAISVRDDGAGIAAEQLPRLFDLYVQRALPEQNAPLKLGAGLALAASLVRMHGGTLSVASAGLAKGSVFTVRLPIAP